MLVGDANKKKETNEIEQQDKVKSRKAMEISSSIPVVFFAWFHDGTGLTRGGRNSTRQWLVF